MRFLTLTTSSLTTFLVSTSFAMEQTAPAITPGYNAPSRIEVDRSYDLFTTASFIYWQPVQENMELGIVANTTDPTELGSGNYVDLGALYRPGFKVGFGVDFDYDKWDMSVEYTWFRAKEHAAVNLDPSNTAIYLIPTWQNPLFLNPKYSSGSESWKLRMDLFDWDLGRSCYIGQKFCVRPSIGVRAAIINQTLNVDYINTNVTFSSLFPSTYINQTSRSWGVGPRFGLASDWNLGAGCRLYGDGKCDILFTQYDLQASQSSDETTPSLWTTTQNNLNYLRTHFDLKLGFGWGTYFANNKWHIDLAADYGFQVFCNQNMFRNVLSTEILEKSIVPNGNLYIQGLTATVRLDF